MDCKEQKYTPGNTMVHIIPPDDGATKARQAVAQSTALAVQDATDNLRNLSAISSTAIGVSLAQFIQTGDPRFMAAITQAQGVAEQAANQFGLVGQKAGSILGDYPGGSDQ